MITQTKSKGLKDAYFKLTTSALCSYETQTDLNLILTDSARPEFSYSLSVHEPERFPISKRHSFWKEIPDSKWNDWTWQLSNRVMKIETIRRIVGDKLTQDEAQALMMTQGKLLMGITPYYLSLIDLSDPKDPLRLQSIPQIEETYPHIDDSEDPLGEDRNMPVLGITHRYPDRVLFYTTHNCAMYCRHCTRKRKVSNPSSQATIKQIESGLQYIRQNPMIRDVVVSGGDPLSFTDSKLLSIIERLFEIPHIEMLRIGTRMPVTLPQRITTSLAEGLKRINNRTYNGKRKTVYINTHFNHPNECTPEAVEAAHRLRMAGCPLGNQTVLLRGVNDDGEIMKALYRKLLEMGIKPYYIYLCDPVPGTSHFRTPVEKGFEIIDTLRGFTSGLATPNLVIDAPGGGGKILVPNNAVGLYEGNEYSVWKLLNYEKKIFYYLAPRDRSGYYERSTKVKPKKFDIRDCRMPYCMNL